MAGVAIVNGLTAGTLLPGFGRHELCLRKCPQKPSVPKVRAQTMGHTQNMDQHKPVKVSADRRRLTSQDCTVVGHAQEALSTQLVSDSEVCVGMSMAGRIRAIEAEIPRMKLEFALEEQMGVEQEVIGEQEKVMEMFLETQRSEAQKSSAAPLKHPYAHLNVSERWQEIQGSHNWEGLLDPIDPVLRGEMLRYGELVQATYDAFDFDNHSRFRGSCKYSKKRLLSQVGLENRGYEITDYLYGTCGGDNLMAKFFQKLDSNQFAGGQKEKEKLQARVWDKESSWMGYVAVATDPDEIARLGRRDIVVVWRGTVTKLEWLENLRDYLAPSELDERNASGNPLNDLKVEAGFLAIYKSKNESSPYTKRSARQQVLEAVKRLVQKYSHEENVSITVAGHSLGSALAKLSAYDIAESRINHRSKVHCHKHRIPEHWGEDHKLSDEKDQSGSDSEDEEELGDIPITVYSFGGPRVGNDAFRDRVEQLRVRVMRVVNEHDKVTQLPGVLINEKWQFLEKKLNLFWKWLETLPWTYSHIGVEFKLNNLNSPFLRKTTDPWNTHNLEAYLHLLNGFHGSDLPFSPALPRDLALVNKGSDLLASHHYIPPAWWQEENKGLVRTEEGRWIIRRRNPLDFPEYHIDDDLEECEFQ